MSFVLLADKLTTHSLRKLKSLFIYVFPHWDSMGTNTGEENSKKFGCAFTITSNLYFVIPADRKRQSEFKKSATLVDVLP